MLCVVDTFRGRPLGPFGWDSEAEESDAELSGAALWEVFEVLCERSRALDVLSSSELLGDGAAFRFSFDGPADVLLLALVLPVDEVVLIGTESSVRGNRRGTGLGSRISSSTSSSETSSDADTSDSETDEASDMSNFRNFLFSRSSSVCFRRFSVYAWARNRVRSLMISRDPHSTMSAEELAISSRRFAWALSYLAIMRAGICSSCQVLLAPSFADFQSFHLICWLLYGSIHYFVQRTSCRIFPPYPTSSLAITNS